jgi:hypothetical protein
MAKTPRRAGKEWTSEEVRKLEKLADGNTPTRLIAYKLERSVAAVYGKTSEENVDLSPTNQSPYGTKKK